MGELPSTELASHNFHPSIDRAASIHHHLMMEEPESIGMQKMEPTYSPPGSSHHNHADNPPGYNQYPPTPAPSPPNPNPPPASPGPSDRPSRPPFSITLISFFLVMVFGYFFISYVVIPGWKEVVKEAEKIEAKVRGTTSEPQFDQSLVQVPMSLLRLKERNELDMTPTETAEVYHVTNRIVVPQLTGTAVPTEVDVDDLIHFEPKETMKTASGFVVGEEDTSKDTTACTASGNDGDKKINERDLNDKSVLRSRVARRVTIKDNPSESSKPESSGHDQKDHEPKPRRNTNSWGHDFHNKLKEVATHDQVVEVTKTMSIDEKTLNTDKLPLVLLPPGPGGGVEANDKVKRDHLAHHDPVPATKSKSKPESSEPLQSKSKPESQSSEKKNEQKQKETEKKPGEKHHYHRPDLEAKKKDKSPLVQAVEDVALRFGQKDENFHHVKNKKPDDKKMKHEQDKRDWIHPGQNPKPKVGADPTPREPKTVNLGENYGTEGLHKVQGTVHLPDGRTYYPYGDHYKPRRSVYGWPTQSTQSRAWETMYPHEGDGHYGGVARRTSGAVMPTTTASHQYYGAAPESSSTHAALASTSRPETHGQGYAPAKETRGASNSASASAAYATSTPAVLRRVESFAEKYDVESHNPAASHAAAPHQYWYSPYQRPDGKPDIPNHGKLDVPMHIKPVVPTHDNDKHHEKDGGKGMEDIGGKDKSEGKLAKGKGKAGKGSFHSRRSPGPVSPVGVTPPDWANDVEYGNGLIPRSINGVDCDQITEDTDCSNAAADGSADGSAGSGHSRRSDEPELPESGDGDDKATPLHPNPKGKSWNHWFRGRVGGGGVDQHRNKGEKEKQETETYKESQKKVMVKAMKCGIEIVISKASASGSSVTATASFTVKASPKWWTPHPHLQRTSAAGDVSRSSSSATPTSTPTVATSKPTTTSSSESNGPSHNKNEKGKRAVANAYNDDPHRAQTVLPGILEIHLTPEEAKPELMDAKYDYWEFKTPPDLYVVSDQDSPFNPYAGAREKRKQEAEEAERKRKAQEEHDKTYWHYFKKRPDATDVGCKDPDSLGRVWCLGGYGDVGEYPDERGLK